MATSTFSLAWNNTTAGGTAGFKQIHDALIAAGMVQTSDTGQLNLTTAPTYVATSSYVYGYTVYRFNDSYQSTYPIYVRFEWRNSANVTSAVPSMLISVGESTDGAGAVTGRNAFTPSNPSSTNSTATAYTNYVCVKDGTLTLAIAPLHAVAAVRQLFIIDRLRDLTGQPVPGYTFTRRSTNGTTMYMLTSTASTARTYLASYNHSNTPSSTNTPTVFAPFAWQNETTTMNIGGDIPFFPMYIMDPDARTSLGELHLPLADVAFNTDITVTRFGASHTYKALGGQFGGPGDFFLGNLAFAMLWE